jgi:hypothetical protein
MTKHLLKTTTHQRRQLSWWEGIVLVARGVVVHVGCQAPVCGELDADRL